MLLSAGKHKLNSIIGCHGRIKCAALRDIILSLEIASFILLPAERLSNKSHFMLGRYWKGVRDLRRDITRHQKLILLTFHVKRAKRKISCKPIARVLTSIRHTEALATVISFVSVVSFSKQRKTLLDTWE